MNLRTESDLHVEHKILGRDVLFNASSDLDRWLSVRDEFTLHMFVFISILLCYIGLSLHFIYSMKKALGGSVV